MQFKTLISYFRALAFCAFISSAVAAPKSKVVSTPDSFTNLSVTTIEVKGLKRIEQDAVLGKISTKVGTPLSRETLRSDTQSLFNMGYFDDISVDAERDGAGVKLVIALRERPVISEVAFDGNERVNTSDLEGVIKVKAWSILDINKVKDDVALIVKHYEDKGFYLAKVTFEITQLKPDEVKLTYKISDYEKVQIKKITFLNNTALTDLELKAALGETREGGFFSFMSGSGNFKESAFKNDLQRLTLAYLDKGYVKFKYDSPVITVSDDKQWLYITIYVEEGPQYKMGTVDFSGDLLFSRGELAEDVLLKGEDEIFSITKRNLDIQKLTEKYQDLGYAFVNVIPRMNIKDDTKTVDIDYNFEKGNLAYFGEINIVGNTKTHDKVIRRELKIKEGELYHGTRLRQSRENVERLGFFNQGEVIFNSTTPKGRNDVVDIEIQVKERPTGTVTLGAGYGSAKGLFFTTQISESNFLGRGQNLSLSTNITRDRRDKSVNLGFTDPYAFDSNWSVGGDIYYVTFSIPDKYTTRKFGGDVRLGYPLAEFTNAYITYKRERMKIEEVELINQDAADRTDLADDEGELSSVVWSVVRDKRNNRFETTGGNYQSASLETAGIGGDKKFFKWTLNNRYYQRLFGDLVFRNSIEYGQATSYDGKGVPPSERFYLGGPNNLKGYQFYAVGPQRDKLSTDGLTTYRIPEGGSYSMFGLFELEHPIIKDAGLKFVVFYDVGNVFAELPPMKDFSLRQDYGLGFRWFSPIGPLRFEWGFPVSKKAGDDNVVFQFFIGPPF